MQQPTSHWHCGVILLQGGGFRVNNAKVEDEAAVIAEGDLIDGRLLLLAAGKKNKLLLRVT